MISINEEIIEVLNRPSICDRYGVGDGIFEVSLILWEIAELVIDLPDVKVCSDHGDDKFLATADAGRAEYLEPATSIICFGFPGTGVWPSFLPTEFMRVLKARANDANDV